MMLKMFTASSHDRFTPIMMIMEIRQKAEMSSGRVTSAATVGKIKATVTSCAHTSAAAQKGGSFAVVVGIGASE